MILIEYRLSRPILLRMATTMRGTDPTGPLECRSAEWSPNLGCCLETNLLQVATTSGWIASRDLFECRLTGWSTIKSDFLTRAHFKWLQSHVEIQPTSLIQAVNQLGKVQLYLRLSSLRSSRKRESKSKCFVETDDDRRWVEEPLWLWYEMLGTRRSMQKYKQHPWWWRTCVWVRQDMQRGRERDRHKDVMCIMSRTIITKNTTTNLY